MATFSSKTFPATSAYESSQGVSASSVIPPVLLPFAASSSSFPPSATSSASSIDVIIYTEENPQEAEIVFGLSRLGYNVDFCTIKPVYTDGLFQGCFDVTTTPENVSCSVRLFKGTTGSADYLFLKSGHEPLLMESTKTLNGDSRNSFVYQRIIKFLVARHYYPTADKVMFYTAPPTFTTPTAMFGLRLFATLGIAVCSPTGTTVGTPFTSPDELISSKNAMKEKAGNVSVRLSREGSVVTIRGRLNKTEGRMDYDPNVGLFSAMMGAMHKLSPELSFRIIDHGLDIDKIRMNNKFWYASLGIPVEIDGFVAATASVLPSVYFNTVTGNEKTSTILFQHQSGLSAAFHNHAGCQRSSITAPDKTTHAVPKTVTMPDVVLVNADTHTIYLVEGKDNSKVAAAQDQLDALGPFEELIGRYYPGFTCKRGLCINVDKESCVPLRYPVWFRLYSDGRFTKTFDA